MNASLSLTLSVAACLISACASPPAAVYVDREVQQPVPIYAPPAAAQATPAQRQPPNQPARTAQAPARPPVIAPALPSRAPAQPWPGKSAQEPPASYQPSPLSADPLDASVYRLGSGDTVRIEVLGEAELTLDALIDPSGMINYPFLGTIAAAGGTVRDLQQRIRNDLRAGYLVNPDVRVSLASYRPVFISGQVRTPGSYPYTLGLNVEKAITLAGGLTPFGSTSRIYRQRGITSPSNERSKVSLESAVLPGDYIIVDERIF